ncbi:MAG: rod shape-determining protein MreD [Acetobacteraceae bacterium]
MSRRSVPITCTLALMLASKAPFNMADQAVLLPAVTVISVFFWSLFRPSSMPAAAVFLIGILLDLLGWMPLGEGTVVLLVVHALCLRWRRLLAKQGFAVIWLVFLGFAAGAAASMWALTALLAFRWLPVTPALFQAVLTAALYPALAIAFAGANRGVAAPERA